MTAIPITRLRPTDDVSPGLVALVQAAATGPPYNYAEGDVQTGPGVVPRAGAAQRTVSGRRDTPSSPLGYCVTSRLAVAPGLDQVVERLGVEPARTLYLAELGVARAARRQGIGAALVDATIEVAPTDVIVVRALVEHHAAIALYQRLDFTIVAGVEQTHRGRRRLFLIRHPRRIGEDPR